MRTKLRARVLVASGGNTLIDRSWESSASLKGTIQEAARLASDAAEHARRGGTEITITVSRIEQEAE